MKRYFLLTMLMAFAFCMRANTPQQEGTRDDDWYFDLNIHTYPTTMTYMAILEINGVEPMREDLELGLFVGDECRGRAKPSSMYAGITGHYLLMFSVYGNEGDNISTFRLYDHALQEELNVTCTHDPIVFVVNQQVGDPMNPDVFNFISASTFTITATANPEAGGMVTGGGSYEMNAQCTLTATANAGYTFVNWTKNNQEVSTNATYTFTVTEAGDYVANFQLNGYQITATANPEAGGIVTGGGSYEMNAQCTLTATANVGYTFINWTKNNQEVSTDTTYTFTVTEAGDYVANFQLNSYQITATANPEIGGLVTGTGTYNHFQTCTLTATANEGYTFVNWTKNNQEVSTDATYTFTVTEAGDYVANFQLNSYQITVMANLDAGGSATGTGTYYHFDTCTLIATVNEHYHFVNWTKDGEEVSTEAIFSFTVTEGGTYVANFQIDSFEITATVNPEGGGIITGAGMHDYGTTCTLSVNANPGYSFINWTKNGEQVSTTESFSFLVTEAGSYVANFEIVGYNVTVEINLEAGGTVVGGGVYVYGATATLMATANEGYHFINWTQNGEVVTTEATYTFTVTQDTTYSANFELNSYEITVTANPTAGGIVTGANTYNHFETCSLTATANEGYTFINWTKNGEEVSTEATYGFVVTEAAAYVANFQLNSYEIAAMANPEAGGVVTGADTYNHFDTCTLTATANEGYTFVNWTKNGEEVSTEATYSFVVTGAGTYVANFQLNSYQITVMANPEAGGMVTGANTYNHFETCNLTATANEGYTFVNWTKNGEEVSTEATYSFVVTGAGTYVANFQLNSYQIAVMANPEAGGIVTGANTYNHFETCTLTATANEGYTFINWTKDGEEVSNNATYSFTVTEAGTYVANFQINSYEITVDVNLAEGGTAEGGGTFNHFETITLTATANVGYSFLNWTLDGQVVSTSANYTFTVTGGGNYVANFQLNSYQITATANPTAGGTITGAGTYNHFETCTLTAYVNTGYTFINWTKNGQVVSTETTISFDVTGAASYVANFQINTYEITAIANPSNGGTVSGIGTYNYGQTCTLVATASEGYTFVNWIQNGQVVSTSANYSFTVTGDGNYVANFQLNSYQITVSANPTAGGTVTGTGTYNHFETCTLTATPNENYIFVNWTLNGTVVSTSATYSFTVTGSGNYVATFAPNEFQITATANPTNGGIVTGTGVYNYGTTATLTATANSGFTFVNWTKNGVVVSTNAVYSFTVTEAGSYVAHFNHNDCHITATANPTAGGSITGAGTYAYGTNCTLTATANAGYTFVRWTKDGVQVSTSASFSFVVTEDASYVAHFSLNQHFITVTADPNEGGTVSGGGAYQYGESCTVTAFAHTGYHFVNWTKNGVQVSTDPSYTFTVTEDATLVGHFALNQYQITATADPSNAGTISGAGIYTHGTTATLTAHANSGYIFVNWTRNGVQVSTSETYSFTVTESGDYVAHFTTSTHIVTTGVNPAVGGEATGAGTYNHGESCTVEAIPNDGYAFVKWMVNGVEVSTTPSYTFIVTENVHCTAYFTLQNCTITVEAMPAEGGEVSGAGVYAFGDDCTLNATANNDYVFVEWRKDNVQVSTSPLYSFTVTEDAHYVAVFVLSTYQITATVDPQEGGTITGAGTYAYGASATLTVTPNENYVFVNWTENGNVVSEEETLTINNITSDHNYVAHLRFVDGVGEHNGITVTVFPNPAKDRLAIEASEPINLFEIYTINGALVYRQKDCPERLEISVTDFSVGTYMIRLTTDSAVETRRFVKE